MKFIISLLSLWALDALMAQVPAEVSFRSFGQSGLSEQTSHNYAIVIGLSRYRDSTLPVIGQAHRDAQSFAVWLQSRSGGFVPPNQIILLVNEQATLAQVIQAINDQSAKCVKDDQLIFYFSGYASGIGRQYRSYEDIYFYDTPYSSGQSGSHQIVRQFSDLVKKMHKKFQYYGLLYPIPGEDSVKTDTLSEAAEELFDVQFVCKNAEPKTDTGNHHEVLTKTLNHHLLDAFHGLADLDHNGKVQFSELQSYFKQLIPGNETARGLLFAATKGKKTVCARTQTELIGKQTNLDDAGFPGIFNLSGLERETEMIQIQVDSIKSKYQDFLVSLHLGQLLPPDSPNAYTIYEELVSMPAIMELRNGFRRRLIVSLIDESQQAINAYLNLDPNEWMQRISMREKYLRYPKYIEKANQLLGENNFMSANLQSKQYYFEGLNKRFEAMSLNDSSMMRQALDLQRKALHFESESAFIHNEMGTIYGNLGKRSDAIRHYELAINISPTWSIPYINLALQMKDSPQKALGYLRKAIQLNPSSAFAYNNMGIVYMEEEHFSDAEEALIKAITLEPRYAEAYYNLACVRSIQNETESAMGLLERAFYLGLNTIQHVQEDPDLLNLRNAPGYKAMVKRYFPNQKSE